MYALTLSRNAGPAKDDSGIVLSSDYTLRAFDDRRCLGSRVLSKSQARDFYRAYGFIRLPDGSYIAATNVLPYALSVLH